MKKKILIGFLLGIALIFSSCGMSGKIENFKNTQVVKEEPKKSIFECELYGTIDEFAEEYITSLDLKKEDFKIKLKTLEPNYCYIVTYKWKKEKLEFTIYLDEDYYLYAPTYMMTSNNEKHLDEVIDSLEKINFK
ncbi:MULTISPECIES: hypothetical protein [Fusobacterium]|uniref:hypothetical protein n=1 Tax=Fusobacterium TaxID=848 RepID=UPI001476B3CC|nr:MULTISPECIES: hypothetical protein [Fusobacterium]NME35587.1 hypothetical protein [Fusobacterium sp. FSA-380-WT-3A]